MTNLVNRVPLLNSNLFGSRANLRRNELLQITYRVVLAANKGGWGRKRDGGVSVINGKSGRGACATHETLHVSASIGRLSKARQRTCTSLALSSPAYRSISPLSSPFLVSHTCCSWRPLHGVARIQNRVNNCVRVKKVLFFFFSE